MRLSRRAALAASMGLLSGCQAPQVDTQTMTDRTPRHFNDSDELTSDVNNQSVTSNEVTIGVYPTIDDVPTTKSAGFIAVVEDGHLVLEDGQ